MADLEAQAYPIPHREPATVSHSNSIGARRWTVWVLNVKASWKAAWRSQQNMERLLMKSIRRHQGGHSLVTVTRQPPGSTGPVQN